MMGHTNRDMYIHANLKSIQDKLDRFQLGGKTLEEHEADVLANGIPAEEATQIRNWHKRRERSNKGEGSKACSGAVGSRSSNLHLPRHGRLVRNQLHVCSLHIESCLALL